MRLNDQRHFSDVLAECRRRLDEARVELDGQRAGTLEAVAADVLVVEDALRRDSARRPRRSFRRLAHDWSSPRLGSLRHHSPQPLLVPWHYYRTDAPSPAPTISIVTPSLNQGRFLERALYSVRSQGYPRVEHVVRDGGSEDESPDVLLRRTEWLASWTSEPDGGQADAINRGFANTHGEIMAYLNADDLLLPGALAYVARYLDRHPDVDVVYGHRLLIDEHDGVIGRWVLPPHDSAVLAWADFVPQETLFWRRSVWDAAGGALDGRLDFAIDWDLLLRFSAAGARFVRLPRYLGAFRVHDEQKTLTQFERWYRECRILLEREHHRPVSLEEVRARVNRYARRHVAHHTLHRAAVRLPLPRVQMRTIPPV
jgi:GT2 family glycosyltransferase